MLTITSPLSDSKPTSAYLSLSKCYHRAIDEVITSLFNLIQPTITLLNCTRSKHEHTPENQTKHKPRREVLTITSLLSDSRMTSAHLSLPRCYHRAIDKVLTSLFNLVQPTSPYQVHFVQSVPSILYFTVGWVDHPKQSLYLG